MFKNIKFSYGYNILLDGFFQSDKYFYDCIEDVRNLFYFPLEVVESVKSFLSQFDKTIVGIHIRRGDYLKVISYHGIQKADYYVQASKMFDNFNSVICTDDWDAVQNEMKFSKAVKSPFMDEISDLYLMSQCDGLVICNSSFSWWGAFLGKDKEKVIAPKNWFGVTGPKDCQDIYRNEWIRL